MDSLTLDPITKVDGEVNLPGSKSLSNRALLLAALAEGTTTITNLLDSDDIRHMLTALKKVGVSYQLSEDKTQCVVEGNGGPFQVDGEAELFLGNAGTAMRPLCATLCLGSGVYDLTGEPRMSERPIDALVETLRQTGCDIEYLTVEGFPPVRIKANGIEGGEVSIDGSISSQFLTAILMAAPLAKNDLTIKIKGELVSKPYIDITLHIMQQFGVTVENQDYSIFKVKGNTNYKAPGKFLVEGDASSASYFLAAGAIKGGKVKVTGIGKNSIQGDTQFAKVLEDMGAKVEWADDYIAVEAGDLQGVDQDMNHIPVRNVYNWRVKETDRLFAMATELRKLGVQVEEGEDYITITPAETLKHAEIDTYNDHRIAMCFSLVALSDTPVTINDPGCTALT